MSTGDNELSPKDQVRLALLEEKVKELESDSEHRITSLEKDRDSALRWGIVVLGTSVLSMGAWIFKLLTAKIPL